MKIILSILSLSLIIAGIFFNIYLQKPPPLVATTLYPEAKVLPQFELMDHNNQLFNNQQLMGKWSIVFFGYTFCPDVCPTTLAALAQVANSLEPEILNQVQFIFISVDPQRDTLERLAQYVPFYHADFIGVTGTDEQLQKFSMSLGAVYIKVPTDDSYAVSHSSTLFIIDPMGRRHGIFSHATAGAIDVVLMAQDLDTLVRFGR